MKSTMDIRDFYDNEALASARYATAHFWERRYHIKRKAFVQKLLEKSFKSCKTYLDIGCGTGEYLSFARQFADYVCGLDISKNYLHRCKSRKADDLIIGDSNNLPFQNQAFDCVLCSEVIEHIKPHETAIREILRVSKKFAVVSTPNHGLLRMLMAKLGRQKLSSLDAEVGHINILRFQELMPKFKSHGWRVSAAFTVSVFPPFLDVIHFPKAIAPIIDLLERAMDKSLNAMGSVTIIDLECSAEP